MEEFVKKATLNGLFLKIQNSWYYFPTIQSREEWAAVIANMDLFPQVCISFRACDIFPWQAARD